MLHITNGDSVRELIHGSGIPGTVLAWRDVLHEGPVPAGLSLDELREVRAHFIAECGWGDYTTVLHELYKRDTTLADFREHEEVVLWFEHDLYDQLQLIQLLHWFSRQDWAGTRLSLICIGAFPGVAKFYGLGQLSAEQIASLYPTRTWVTDAQLALGRRAWQAFCSPDPMTLEALLAQGTIALPFLAAALRRHLQQFPSIRNGLSRTENQVLEALATGPFAPRDLFKTTQGREEVPFMGDTVFWTYLDRLARGRKPLLAKTRNRRVVQVTRVGIQVHQRVEDCIRVRGIDRWLGGVHLYGKTAWRWDEGRGRLIHVRSHPLGGLR
jgi:hypothetical protein